MTHLDGNVLAGPLSEVFAVEMTTATGRCVGCGDVSPLALAMVVVDRGSYVVACHTCGSTLFTVTPGADAVALDLAGIDELTLPRPT
jgi:ribosomal protein S27E